MTRDQGIELSNDTMVAVEPRRASFCEYIGISLDQFWQQVHANLNRDLFDLAPNGTITPRFRVGEGL